MDALEIEQAIVAGFDWGARTANIVAALWPERCTGAGLGERLPDRQPGGRQGAAAAGGRAASGGTSTTSPPSAAGPATTSTGATSPSSSGRPPRRSGTSTTRRSSAARRRSTTPITSTIVIHNYRWRLGLADGRAAVRRARAAARRRRRRSPCPTITLEGDANGAPHPDPSAYADEVLRASTSTGRSTGGVGHNLPQEAPQAFAQAVIDVDTY